MFLKGGIIVKDFLIQVLATLVSTLIIFLISNFKNVTKHITKKVRRIILILVAFFISTCQFVFTFNKLLNSNFDILYISNTVLLMFCFFNIVSSVNFIYAAISQN